MTNKRQTFIRKENHFPQNPNCSDSGVSELCFKPAKERKVSYTVYFWAKDDMIQKLDLSSKPQGKTLQEIADKYFGAWYQEKCGQFTESEKDLCYLEIRKDFDEDMDLASYLYSALDWRNSQKEIQRELHEYIPQTFNYDEINKEIKNPGCCWY